MADASYSPRRHFAAAGALEAKLAALCQIAEEKPVDPRIRDWAMRHLALDGPALEAWGARAWWGVAAGELLRHYLYDRTRRDEALALLRHADWSLVDAALAEGGVILAAAHLGPPKFAMNALIARYARPMILTNTDDMPDWLPDISGPLLNPLVPENRARIMLSGALHLRAGGLLFGAPDGGFSSSQLVIEAFNKPWPFSPGLSALARMMGRPAFTLLALWDGTGITLRTEPIVTPPSDLPAEAWDRSWIWSHWTALEPVIRNSPENLRSFIPVFRPEFER